MIKNYKVFDVCVCEDNKLSNMVAVFDTIEEASNFIGCSTSALYKSLQLTGEMKAKGYIIELVEREDNE